jgi:hypothetical protein
MFVLKKSKPNIHNADNHEALTHLNYRLEVASQPLVSTTC